MKVITDMVVTVTVTNFHHSDVAVTLSNVLMRWAYGNAKERFGCRKGIKHIAVDDMVTVTNKRRVVSVAVSRKKKVAVHAIFNVSIGIFP